MCHNRENTKIIKVNYMDFFITYKLCLKNVGRSKVRCLTIQPSQIDWPLHGWNIF